MVTRLPFSKHPEQSGKKYFQIHARHLWRSHSASHSNKFRKLSSINRCFHILISIDQAPFPPSIRLAFLTCISNVVCSQYSYAFFPKETISVFSPLECVCVCVCVNHVNPCFYSLLYKGVLLFVISYTHTVPQPRLTWKALGYPGTASNNAQKIIKRWSFLSFNSRNSPTGNSYHSIPKITTCCWTSTVSCVFCKVHIYSICYTKYLC